LGPLLFLIYINDLGSIFKNMTTIIFADDSNLIVNGKTTSELERKIMEDITRLTSWLRTNRLSLNLLKTHIMVFGRKREGLENSVNIIIDGAKIEIVNQTKFLGVILDSGLTWKQHLLHISKKISKSVGILSRARKFLNKKTLLQLYYSFLYPYLTYCNIIWGNAPDYILWPIFRAQKRAIRIVNNIRRRDSTRKAFEELRILRLPGIYTFSVLIFVYKYKNELLPTPFSGFYITHRQVHRYPTRNANQLRIPMAKTKMAARFVRSTGVNIWNAFDNIISTDMGIGALKRAIITNLTARYSLPA
jgi:hypothetical protein